MFTPILAANHPPDIEVCCGFLLFIGWGLFCIFGQDKIWESMEKSWNTKRTPAGEIFVYLVGIFSLLAGLFGACAILSR